MTAERSQHTPGPWHIGMNPGPLVYGPNGEQVADLRAPMTPKDEALANLRLIVAAPELMEALTYIHDHARTGLDSGGNVYLQLNLVKQKAAQLLAKAEGRS